MRTDDSSVTFVLLRGLSREAAHWGSFPEKLRAAVPGAKVITVDLPGTGRFHELDSPPSIPAITDFVRSRVAESAAPGTRPILVALSFGAMVAAHWLFTYPDELRGAILINTSLKGYSPIYKRLTPTALKVVLTALTTSDAASRERAILRLVSNRPWDEATAEKWISIQRERPVRRSNALRQLAAAALYRPPRRPPRIPVLLLHSLADALAHPDCSRALAALWNAPLKTHPSGGHDLTLDDPDWVASQAAGWAASLTES